MSRSSVAIEISKVRAGVRQTLADSVAVEEPLEIRLGYSTPDGRATRSISITMRTPGNDRELASRLPVHRSHHQAQRRYCIDRSSAARPRPTRGNHNVIRVDLAADVEVDLGRLQRHFYTTSSCGVCGKTSLDALRVTGAEAFADQATSFRRSVLTGIPEALRIAQHTFDKTGGLHAAAAFDPAGDLIVLWKMSGGIMPSTRLSVLCY